MSIVIKKIKFKSIAVIGNYLPRRCGIATFTTDLCNALKAHLGDRCHVAAVALDDVDGGYAYPEEVKFQIRDNKLHDYIQAADFLNVHQFDVAILQHEFGIFGGKSGSHILQLLKDLNMPVITVLHTVLKEPSDEQRKIFKDLVRYSDYLVVMSKKAQQMLRKVFGIPKSKISFIHHGIPDIGFEDPCFHKDTFGIEDRKVIFSFGLLHPGKGIEIVLNSMPKIIEQHPDVLYIILGATHPNIVKKSGEAYRDSLLQLVNRLKLKNYVEFKNRFVELEELCHYIGAADIYITPYLSQEQIVSGTLAYTLGAGKAIVSTPYWYAEEILADGRGRLVPFGDSDAITNEINELLSKNNKLNTMRKKAYQFGRKMVWKEIAREYLELCIKALDRKKERPRIKHVEPHIPTSVEELPEPKLYHLRCMTDSTGILQHANYAVPNRYHGYCTDDNTRALIVTSMHYSLYKDESVNPLTQTYLSFLFHAFNKDNRRFRNFMSYDRRWLDKAGSEDSHGRALWGLGASIKHAPNDSIRYMATRLFSKGLEAIEKFVYPRAWAFSLMGLRLYLDVYGGDAEARRLRTVLAKKLFTKFKKNAGKDWFWIEETATYANAKLPLALILSGQRIPDLEMYDMGITALEWLLEKQTSPEEGHLSIIGNSGWFKRGDSKPSAFDQQPLEAMGLVEACAEVYRSTVDKKWLLEAQRCLNWFLGRNDLNIPLYDFRTGGCSDGLQPHGVNANLGAESTLSWLISLLTMYEIMWQQSLIDAKKQDNAKPTKTSSEILTFAST